MKTHTVQVRNTELASAIKSLKQYFTIIKVVALFFHKNVQPLLDLLFFILYYHVCFLLCFLNLSPTYTCNFQIRLCVIFL